MLQKLIIGLLLALTWVIPAGAAEKLVRQGGTISHFVLQNTTNPAFEGYIVIVLEGTEFKIVYQTGPANHETFTDWCNVNDHLDPCNTYDPGPVMEEWDNATQIADGDLTPANRRKWIWAWTYQEHVKRAVGDVEDWLKDLSGLGPTQQKRVLSGAYQAWGLVDTDADFCAALAIDEDLTCTHSETGMFHVTGRIKRLVEDLHRTVLDLP